MISLSVQDTIISSALRTAEDVLHSSLCTLMAWLLHSCMSSKQTCSTCSASGTSRGVSGERQTDALQVAKQNIPAELVHMHAPGE